MSNKVYRDGFYNEEVKERFLRSLEQDSASQLYNFRSVLSRAQSLEESFSKDLYDFSLDQIEQLIKYFNCSTLTSVQNRIYNITNYISWAIKEGYTNSNINPLSGILSLEYYKKFVSVGRSLITDEELFSIINRLVNYQDKALLYSIFEGILGKALSELSNLRTEDIDKDNLMINLNGIDGSRVLKMKDDTLINLLIMSCNEQSYMILSGRYSETTKNRIVKGDGTIMIHDSPYAFKHLYGENNAARPVQRHTILRRVSDIKDYLGGEFNFITPTNIRNSGMLRMAKDIFVENKRINDDDIIKICERYNLSTSNYAWHHTKRNLLNVETIKDVYQV